MKRTTNQFLKRGMSLLLVLIMALTMIPMTAFAGSTDDITVYVTISVEDELQLSKDGLTGMVQVPVTVNKGATAFDALVKAHKMYHEEGDDGYIASDTKYFSKLWGKESTSIGYFTNGKMVMNTSAPLSDGDDIEGTVYKDWTSDIYSRFDKQSATITAGEAVPITLLSNGITTSDWKGGMMAGDAATEPLREAKILVGDSISCNIPYDESNNWITDEKGKATISFENPGIYYISAKKEGKNIIPPICKVTVTAPISDTEKAQIVSQDKDALTNESIKGENSSINEADQLNGIVDTQIKELKENIASAYALKNAEWWGSSATWWHAVGMSAYSNTSTDTTRVVSADSKQAFMNKTISDITSLGTTASTNANKLANAVNGMSAFGYDPTALWSINKSKIDAVSQLKNIKLEDAQKGWYSTIAPYVLLSLNQGEYNSETLENEYIIYLLGELENADWSWGVDTPAMVLQGLTPYYSRVDVKTAIDKIILTLSEKQGVNGSYGSANSDALVIVALAQLGINPHTDNRFIKNGKSLVDSLLNYRMTSNDGFWYTSGIYDEYATEQGFLALIAASEVMKNPLPYNVYDFSKVSKNAAYANGTGGKEELPKDPVSDAEIKVYLTLKTDSATWIPRTTTTVKSDATVYNVFTKVLNEKGFNYIISNKNYVSSITNSSGTCLSEFDKGKNSGWLYKVNGELPNIALTKCNLYDGDNIVWYYTTDWTKDPDAVEAAGGKSAVATFTETEKAEGKAEAEATTDKNGKASAAVQAKDITKAIEAVLKASEKLGATSKKEVKIVVKADSKAKEVETKLTKDSMVELNKKVDVVTVQTPLADIVFDKQNLELMSKNINGDVKLSVRKVDFAKEGGISEDSKSQIKEKIGDRPIFDFNLTVGDKKISNFADKVQVSVPYTASQSENVNGIVVYYINDNGNLEIVKDCKYDSKTKTLTFSTNHFSNYAVGYKNISFNDISKHWAKDQIVYLAARDVVKGVNDAGFAPNDKVTRAEFVQILANLSGAELSKYGNSKFKDVKKEVWFANSASWAAEMGLVTGNSNNDGTVSFNPNESITRQDMAVILSRFMSKIEQKKLSEVNKEVKFADKNQIGSYAESAVAELQKAGIINGKTTDSFAPKENATRAECSKMIAVLMQNYL